MKNIKNLGITTKEGFSVKNLQRFPSMEWGPEGGLQAELYYNKHKVLDLFNAGDGGCANVYLTDKGTKILDELKAKGLEFLKRVDKDYGPDSKYSWMKTKTAATFDDDDWEMVITIIEERAEDIKTIKQCFKKGYKAVAIIRNDSEKKFLQYRFANINIAAVKSYLTAMDMKQYSEIVVVTCNDDITVL